MVDLQEVFKRYEGKYNHILSTLYPSKGSTGFPERNLSVNFSKAYEMVADEKRHDVVSWFEFQFGKNNNNHVDLIMVNNTSNEVFIVESKRFSNPNKKVPEVGKDIERIYSLSQELINDQQRINMENVQHVYGIILADVWLETESKNNIYTSFKNESFISDYTDLLSLKRELNEYYYCQDVSGKEKWLDGYKLVSIVWEVL